MPPKPEPKKWKPPKGPKPVQHKNKNTIGLGRSIANVKRLENKITYLPDGEMRFTTDKHAPNWVKLRSVTQENSLDEFLNTAELADTDFTSEKSASVRIISIGNTSDINPYLLNSSEEKRIGDLHRANSDKLRVPRRPEWESSMSRNELERLEKDSFLEWRRQLAHLQENNDLLLTPFERNIEVWRQLWRVVERSDLVVQIVDARNPLAFRCKDLENYVCEVGPEKKNLLLVNKADMLTYEQRVAWANYFMENDIPFVFFSALSAQELLDKQQEEEEQQQQGKDEQKQNQPEEEEEAEGTEEADEGDEETQPEEINGEVQSDLRSNTQENSEESTEEKIKILSIQELEALFLSTNSKQIGLVGYPNVGKSSTINALAGAKKVSVSSTPGKTKHFQTIHLTKDLILCDCPGLVFPNFAYTNGELVCNGVLPIDQLKEHTAPCELVAQRIPKFYIEAIYGISIPIKPISEGGSGVPTAQELLTAYARARGYMTQGFGSADEKRAARYILKDYVSGKLLYVNPPPNENNMPISVEEARKFNVDLYDLLHLPESRRDQVIQAARSKGLKESEISLERDMAKLEFSAHVGDGVTHGGKQAALISVGDEVDMDFFKMNGVKGNFSTPFHKTVAANGSKKHGKKNKNAKKKILDY